jgi:hypothetical protein
MLVGLSPTGMAARLAAQITSQLRELSASQEISAANREFRISIVGVRPLSETLGDQKCVAQRFLPSWLLVAAR